MISHTAEYALRAVIYLAHTGETSQTARVIAEATKVPEDYLAKVMKNLARHGVVKSRRGIGGGFALTGSPSVLSVHDVISAVEPFRRFETCPLELPWHCEELCALHASLDEMVAQFENRCRETMITDLLPAATPVKLTPAQIRRKKKRA